MSPSTSTKPTNPPTTFASLGVRPVINCMGTYTFISGSRMVPQAAQAMYEASNHYVHMDDLMEKVGQRLAQLTGAEWGYITCGCAAALNQIAAACIAGADPEKMARLPESEGMKNEVISQKAHRNSYDRAILGAGAKMIEVETVADLRAAINERTALIAIVGDIEEYSTIPIPEMIRIGHEYGIPCLVDAAAQRPNVPNRYLAMGADVVLYSGGKCLRGPQASGLALGRKDLLQAAFLNGAPHHGEGRTMKAGKEEIMGLLGAVEAWLLGRDHDAEWIMWEAFLETIRVAVADLPSIRTEIIQPGYSNNAPQLGINWDPAVLHATPAEIHQELLDGEPRIIMHQTKTGLRVMPYMMEEGDAEIAAKRLRELLANRPAKPAVDTVALAPACDVSGVWQIHTRYILGESKHSMTLKQEGSALSGVYRSQYTTAEVKGTIQGDKVELRVVLGYQSNMIGYGYSGVAQGDTMRGEVSLGEYWTAAWEAKRLG